VNSDLITLSQWMAGDFSNAQQSATYPQKFAHIHVLFRPLPFEFFKAIGFYSEQVYDYDLWTPYRQGIHKLVDLDDRIYIENYSLEDPIRFAGSGRELSILKTIKPSDTQRRYNCSMVFRRDGEMFRGEVEGKECPIEKNGIQTYLVSEVQITKSTWVGIDRGFDCITHQQVWGSEHGAFQFEKKQSFADELMLDRD
jgi:CpeT protein